MCVFAGKRDPKVLFTCFAVLTTLLSLGAVCNRCGVADRICVRIDAQPREIEATPRPHTPARPYGLAFKTDHYTPHDARTGDCPCRCRRREAEPLPAARRPAEARQGALPVDFSVAHGLGGRRGGGERSLRVVTTRLPAASPGTNSVGKLGAMF